MSKKKKTMLVAAIVLGIAVLGLAAGVYAKYISSVQKTGTAQVAKWAFTEKNTSGSVECKLDETYDSDTLSSGKIAPGTSGYCPIVVSNEATEVGITYTIKPSTEITNQPTNLKFYKDAGHTKELTSTSALSGTLTPGEVTNNEAYVYWAWAYQDGTEGYDSADTANGVSAATMTMKFDVTGTQLEPTN